MSCMNSYVDIVTGPFWHPKTSGYHSVGCNSSGKVTGYRAKEFVARFSVAKVYGSYEQLAQDNDMDIVYVGTIHPTHYDCCMKMLNTTNMFSVRNQ